MSDSTKDGQGYYADEDDYIQDPPSRKKPVDFGNTLDYYNDDMSRKAVGRLFEEAKPSNVPDRDDEDLDIEQKAEGSFEDSPEGEDYGVVRGFDKPAAPPERKPPRQAPRYYNDVDDDSDYAFSLYRKKGRKNSDDDYDMPGGPPEPDRERERERERETARESARPRPQRAASPQHVKPPQQHPPQHPRQAYDTKPEPTKIERPVRVPYQNATKTPTMTKPTAPAKKPVYRDDDDYDDFGAPQLPTKLIVIGGIIFIAVLLMATLVFQLTSARSKLKTANEEIEAFDDIERRYGQVSMEKEQLLAENESLKQQLQAAKENPAPVESDAEETEGEEGTDQPESSSRSGTTSYTVVSGDTLSKISSKFYGSTSGVSKIQDANGMSGTDIRIGQVLKIPQ